MRVEGAGDADQFSSVGAAWKAETFSISIFHFPFSIFDSSEVFASITLNDKSKWQMKNGKWKMMWIVMKTS